VIPLAFPILINNVFERKDGDTPLYGPSAEGQLWVDGYQAISLSRYKTM